MIDLEIGYELLDELEASGFLNTKYVDELHIRLKGFNTVVEVEQVSKGGFREKFCLVDYCGEVIMSQDLYTMLPSFCNLPPDILAKELTIKILRDEAVTIEVTAYAKSGALDLLEHLHLA